MVEGFEPPTFGIQDPTAEGLSTSVQIDLMASTFGRVGTPSALTRYKLLKNKYN
jgi:hypothetical protein